jgi:hypothetical protein
VVLTPRASRTPSAGKPLNQANITHSTDENNHHTDAYLAERPLCAQTRLPTAPTTSAIQSR